MHDGARYRALRGLALIQSAKEGRPLTAGEVDAEFDRMISDEYEAMRVILCKSKDFCPSQVTRKSIGYRAGALILYEFNALNSLIRESVAFPEEWPAFHVARAGELTGGRAVEVWSNEWTT